jgi:hypothetical protein
LSETKCPDENAERCEGNGDASRDRGFFWDIGHAKSGQLLGKTKTESLFESQERTIDEMKTLTRQVETEQS